MIKPKCDKCGEELKSYGALTFSPPATEPDGSCDKAVDKFHICADCWPEMVAWLQAPNKKGQSMIPTQTENPKGLHQRYIVSKVSGEPVDPRAEYFVLRVDEHGSDSRHVNACRIAVLAYAHEIEHYLPELASDLFQRYNQAIQP